MRNFSNFGSSPRLRGAPAVTLVQGVWAGLIPASAGSTDISSTGGPQPPAHPRVCGEHQSTSPQASVNLGSSPRLRGAPVDDLQTQRDLGLIPASAGSTGGGKLPPSTPGAHPRVCGEHVRAIDETHPHAGSSPRLRGALPIKMERQFTIRLIPASAGSTACAAAL